MGKLNVAQIFKDVKMIASKHSPEILTGIGIAGMITTTVLAVRATPEALKLIEEKREELSLESDEKLTPVETVKATWKCYVPAVVTGATATACLIGANRAGARQKAALAAAYNFTATTLAEYKDAVVETIGERKEQVVRDKMAEERVKKDPVNQSTVIMTGNGNTRFLDRFSGQRFESDIEKVRRAVNELNAKMLEGEDYVSLNEFYYELGLDGVEIGDDLGWNVSKDGRKGMIDVDFSAQVDRDGKPTIVLEYLVVPKRGYSTY